LRNILCGRRPGVQAPSSRPLRSSRRSCPAPRRPCWPTQERMHRAVVQGANHDDRCPADRLGNVVGAATEIAKTDALERSPKAQVHAAHVLGSPGIPNPVPQSIARFTRTSPVSTLSHLDSRTASGGNQFSWNPRTRSVRRQWLRPRDNQRRAGRVRHPRQGLAGRRPSMPSSGIRPRSTNQRRGRSLRDRPAVSLRPADQSLVPHRPHVRDRSSQRRIHGHDPR